jgi:hypothetical protein
MVSGSSRSPSRGEQASEPMDLRARLDETGTNVHGCRSLRSEVPQHDETVEAAARQRRGSHRRSASGAKAFGRRFRGDSRATVGRSVLTTRIQRGTKKASDLPASGSNARRREIASDRCCRGRSDICRNRSLRRATSHRASGVRPWRYRIDLPAPPAPATRPPESTRKAGSARLCGHRIPWLAVFNPEPRERFRSCDDEILSGSRWRTGQAAALLLIPAQPPKNVVKSGDRSDHAGDTEERAEVPHDRSFGSPQVQ